MSRGGVLSYEGKVLHDAGANTSESVRLAVNITYAVGWVRQEENQHLACPPEIARTLDDNLLRLMGYQLGESSASQVSRYAASLPSLNSRSTSASPVILRCLPWPPHCG